MTGAGTYRGVPPPGQVEQPVDAELTRTAEELAISALGASPYRVRFPLHGAWAVAMWVGDLPRPTRGIDLLDQEHGSVENVVAALHAGFGRSHGGLTLDWSGVRVRTKAERRTPLHRISIPARLGRRQLDLRVDVTAARAPSTIEIRLLRSAVAKSAPIWAACCGVDELVAEKTALLATYGANHTRLQDIFDLTLLSEQIRFDRPSLIKAMASNFEGRDAARMLDRNDAYWEGAFDPRRVTDGEEARWAYLLAAAGIPSRFQGLAITLRVLGRFLVPVLQALREASDIRAGWDPATGWTTQTACLPEQLRHADAAARSDFRKTAIMMMGVSRK